MSIWVILFAKLALGTVTVRQSFSPYVGSQSEGFSYTLSDYFVGPNLNFTVNTTSSTPWTSALQDPFSISILSQATFKGSTAATQLSQNRKLRSYVDSSNYTCILAYYSNNLTSYRLQGNALVEQWTVDVDSSASNAFIQDIAVNENLGLIYAVVSFTTNSGKNYFSQVYAAYNFLKGTPTFVLVPGYSLTPQQAVRIEISTQFAAILNSTNNSMTTVGSVSLFNISDPSNPIFIGNASGLTSPVDLGFYNTETLLVADSKMGLNKYYIYNNTVSLLNQLNQTGMTSIDISGQFGVSALSNKVVLMDLDALVVDELVNMFSSDGTASATAVSGKLLGDMSFVNTYIGSSSNIAVVDFDLLPNQGLARNWNLQSVQSGSFDEFAPFSIFMNADGSYSYVRLDTLVVTLAKITSGQWVLSGFTNAQNFTANVTAFVGANTNDNATLTFTGESMNPSTVIPYSNNEIFTGSVPLDLETNSVYIDLVETLYPNMYFGGSYQMYNVSLTTVGNVTVTTTQSSKTSMMSLAAPSTSTMVSGDAGVYILSDGQNVTTYNFTGTNSSAISSFNYSTVAPSATVTAALYTNGIPVIYSSTNQNIYSPSAPNPIEVPQSCNQFKKYGQYVFCGNSTSVYFYEIAASYINASGNFNATSLGLSQLNFSDITFGTGVSGYASMDYIILVNQTGLIAVSLQSLNTASAPFGNVTAVSSTFTTGDLFAVVHTDGAVDVYTVNYNQLPSLLRTLPGKGTVVSAASSGGILSIQYGAFADVIDLYADGINAFYTTYTSTPCTSSAATANSYVYFLNLCQLNSYLRLGASATLQSMMVNGVRTSPSTALNYPLALTITTSDPYINTIATVATGNITAYNSQSSASVAFTLQVTNQSPYVVSNFEQAPVTLLYSQSMNVPLLSDFVGQNLEFYLNINQQYPTFDYSQFNYDPIVLYPKLVLMNTNSSYDAAALDVNLLSGLTSVVGNSMLYILSNSDMNTVLMQSNVTENYTYCDSISSFYMAATNTTELFINCVNNLTDSQTLNSTLVSVTVSANQITTNTPKAFSSIYSWVKSVTLSTASSLVYLVTDNQDSSGNFAETRFRLQYFYYFNGYPALVDYFEFSFSNFGIDSLSISAIDSYFVSTNNAIVYMADSSWGIRIFNVTFDQSNNQVSQVLVNSIETSVTNPVSIGVCGDWLFVGGSDEQVYQYNLTANVSSPVYVQSFYTTGNFTGAQGNIYCGDSFNPNYVVVPMISNTGNFTGRVLSLVADSNSAIYADLTYDYTSTSGAVAFVSSNEVRALAGSALVDYSLNVPYLSIQSMTAAQFSYMIESYGTNVYDVFVTASNDVVSVNTTTFTLERSTPEPSPDNDDSDDDDDSAVTLWLSIVTGLISLI